MNTVRGSGSYIRRSEILAHYKIFIVWLYSDLHQKNKDKVRKQNDFNGSG
jgi:hypothetical protein